MKRSMILQGFAGVLAAGALLTVLPGRADADWFRRRNENRPRYEAVVVLPRGAARIIVGGSSYYYCRGRYYKPRERDYIRVPAPIGAVVTTLPAQQQTIVIDGITYYSYDGVYYRGGPAGYTVVPVYPTGSTSGVAQNIAIAQPAPTVAAAPAITAAPASPDTFVVNVPNKNGSFTPVALQPASGGMYIGPQGEVYLNLPTAAQLQSMYGR